MKQMLEYEVTEHRRKRWIAAQELVRLRELRGKTCTYGHCPFTECDYVRGVMRGAANFLAEWRDLEDVP